MDPITDLEGLYPVLHDARYTAGWHKARPSLWKEPQTPFAPRHWRYAEARRYVDLAAQWIGTEKAERRNLLMFNPVADNDYASLPNLVAAYQMLRPGEHARAHRHSPNALRLVLDAKDDVYTVVDGVRLPMRPGDVLLTPGWCWHSHFDLGADDAYWIDFLDVPLVHRLESMFFEPHPDGHQPVTNAPVDSPMRFAAADLDALIAATPDHNGARSATLQTPSMRTIALHVHDVAAGAAWLPPKSAAARLLAVVHGAGAIEVGNERFDAERGDVVAVPIWTRHGFIAMQPTRLLEVTDAPVQRALGFHREAVSA